MQVVYGQSMTAKLYHRGSFSPSMYKPGELLAYLRRRGYTMTLHEPIGLRREQFGLAHHPEFVDGVLDCLEENGFGDKDPDIARTLPFTSGSMYQAALLAQQHGMAASFSSGFHHARYDRAAAFCTFNGLVVTAQLLYNQGCIQRLLILDLDYHYGDGTADLIERHGLDYIRHETGPYRAASEPSASRAVTAGSEALVARKTSSYRHGQQKQSNAGCSSGQHPVPSCWTVFPIGFAKHQKRPA